MRSSKTAGQSESSAKRLGIGCFIWAAVLLCNPCLNIIDPLPDFFGYILLIKGLEKWAALCPGMDDAVAGLLKLRWMMLLKLAAMLLVPLVDDTYVLVLTFGFAIIEAVYILPALGRIFAGFEYFATRFSGSAVYKNYRNVTVSTYIFFVGRMILGVIPELCSLSDYEYNGMVASDAQVDMVVFKPLLVAANLTISLILGILWLVNIIPYFRRIGRETAFLDRVAAQYDEEVGCNTGMLFAKRLHTAFLLIEVGIVFLINIWFDGMNFIPNFVAGGFMLAAAGVLAKDSKAARPVMLSSAVFTVLSVISFAVSTVFSGLYLTADVAQSYEAYTLYNVTRVASLLEYSALFVAMLFIYRMYNGIIAEHFGSDAGFDNRLAKVYTKQQRALEVRFAVSFALFIIAFALNLIFLELRVELTDMLREFWLIPMLAVIVYFILHKSVSDELDEQVESKYM